METGTVGKSLPEIEISSAMEEAGFDVLCLFDPELGDTTETAIRIYAAMEAARQSSALPSSDRHSTGEDQRLRPASRPAKQCGV